MTETNETFSATQTARIAGLLYLVIILCGVGGEALGRAPLMGGDAAETTANLLAAEGPFRLSILADVAMALADVGLGVLLFVLFARVDRTLSLMAMAFRLAQAAVLGLNLLNLQRAASLAHSTLLPADVRDGMVQDALASHAAGYDLGLFFFAINCLLVGVLVARSGLAPRVVGIGIVLAGGVYLIGSTLRVVAPELAVAFAPAYVLPLVAELALCGSLLFGARRRLETALVAFPHGHPGLAGAR